MWLVLTLLFCIAVTDYSGSFNLLLCSHWLCRLFSSFMWVPFVAWWAFSVFIGLRVPSPYLAFLLSCLPTCDSFVF